MNFDSADQPPDSYLTLGGPGSAETKVQRSRFLGYAAPVTGEDAARAAVREAGRRHHDARHVCFAWRLRDGAAVVELRNDGGEPAGTAGEPILAALRRAGVSDCLAIVVRWFGGIKLGTGGLARAYGDAAAAALAAAPRRTIAMGREFALVLPYAHQGALERLLSAHDGEVRHAEYADDIRWTIWLPHSRWQAFLAALGETTAGRVGAEPVGPD